MILAVQEFLDPPFSKEVSQETCSWRLVLQRCVLACMLRAVSFLIFFGDMCMFRGRRKSFVTFGGRSEPRFAWQVQGIGHCFIRVTGAVPSARCSSAGRGRSNFLGRVRSTTSGGLRSTTADATESGGTSVSAQQVQQQLDTSLDSILAKRCQENETKVKLLD